MQRTITGIRVITDTELSIRSHRKRKSRATRSSSEPRDDRPTRPRRTVIDVAARATRYSSSRCSSEREHVRHRTASSNTHTTTSVFFGVPRDIKRKHGASSRLDLASRLLLGFLSLSLSQSLTVYLFFDNFERVPFRGRGDE